MWWEQLTKTVLDSEFHADDSGDWNFYKCTILAKRIKDNSLTPPLSCKKLQSDRQFTVVNTAMSRVPPRPEQS